MNLKHTDGRVVVSIDLQAKNSWTFADGTKIRLERQYNELNRRITEPVNAIIISAENIPTGAEVLVHPNATGEPNRIYDYQKLSGKNEGSDIKYYSITEDMCFAWLNNSKWDTLPPYETALRIFKPYGGVISGIEPELVKDTLFVTSGKLKGKVVKTIKAADYEIIFQDTNGQEGRICRFRPNGCSRTNREPEAIAILHSETNLVNGGKLLVGLSKSDCKKINELVYG